MGTRAWFPTLIYDAPLLKDGGRKLDKLLLEECYRIRDIDEEGQRWCAERYPNGYTSYGSMSQLHRMSSTFMDLRDHLDRHVRSFARSLELDLDGRALEMTDCWVNVMPRDCAHTLHLHPTSTISGTYYVKTPKGASCIKFEDPRLPSFMAAPPRKPDPGPRNRTFVEYPAEAGKVVLFESWLRHEVPVSRIDAERVSISFNYGWF
jgi:uncharacterized protein (TIGR02466 family)